MSRSTLAFAALAAILAAWATLTALRSTADRRWAEVKAEIAVHAESEQARGITGPPSWTWDVGRNEPVLLPPEAETVQNGEFAAVVVPESALPRTSLPLWAWVSGYPAWLFHGAFALASVALGALALWLRAR